MKLHPRTRKVIDAEVELRKHLLDWQHRHGLTAIEVSQILTSELQNELRYLLRAERHPNEPNKKADEA